MRKGTAGAIIIAVLISSYCCWAEEPAPGLNLQKDEITAARIDVAKKAGGFIAGWASGYLFHEAGHAVVASFENVSMEWSLTRWTAYTNDSQKLRNIAFAGFGAEILSSEIILGVPAIAKDNAYVLGWLAFDILNPVIYVLRDGLQNGYGDMETLRNHGVNTDLLKIGMLAHAAIIVYRLYRNPSFVPYVGVTKSEIVLGFTKTF